MRTQRSPWQRLVSRSTFGLVPALAALTLFAPLATASPESDAADAIDAAWASAGGDTSLLGSKDGDVYPAGPGFGQNFAGGAVYYTPDTGARIMYGAILDRYRSLGGPADSDLGFPNIDEGPGRIGPDSRNSTFSAPDHPVIFWTPHAGAWVVRGAINAAWDRLGGSAGALGVPIADETHDGDMASQKFSGGRISFDNRTKVFTTDPSELAAQLGDLTPVGDATSAIDSAYRAAGGEAGPLGERLGDQFAVKPDGAGQAFAGGKIFYSPLTGAQALTGPILEKYEAAGGPGDLGFPDAPEVDGGVPDSRMSSFAASDNPVIFSTPDHGAVIVRGTMKAAWDKLGGAAGALGVPLSDQRADGDEVSQRFSSGHVSWNAKTNMFTTDPKELASSLTGLEVPAQVPTTPKAPAPKKDSGFEWHASWLWWIIPLALLLIASLLAWLSGRRRHTADVRRFDDVDPEVAPSYTSTPETPQWSPPVAETEAPGLLSSVRGLQADQEPTDAQSYWEARHIIETPSDRELFTHRGAHAAEDDLDNVDTAPTPVSGNPEGRRGRHAAFNEWMGEDDQPQTPAPGSLFVSAYGATPPAVEPDVRPIEPDITEDRLDDGAVQEVQDVHEVHEVQEVQEVQEGQEEIGQPDDQVAEPHTALRAGSPAPAIHLPLDNPDEAPEGYPVKGSMATGAFYTPGGPGYHDTVADIWFTDAHHAEANGFTRAQ